MDGRLKSLRELVFIFGVFIKADDLEFYINSLTYLGIISVILFGQNRKSVGDCCVSWGEMSVRMRKTQ